jgi:hypothetical protein
MKTIPRRFHEKDFAPRIAAEDRAGEPERSVIRQSNRLGLIRYLEQSKTGPKTSWLYAGLLLSISARIAGSR